jgi:hypothetical protein
MMKKILYRFLICLIGGNSVSVMGALPSGLRSAPPKLEKSPPWMLSSFMELARKDPGRMIRISEKLFAPERMKKSTQDPMLAFEWQHRLAAINALADFFDPERVTAAETKDQVRILVQRAILEDPSLLVRDGAVESVRRVFRMDNSEAKRFTATLERAFMDRKNFSDGEGFFIRETILVAMREGSLPLSKRIRQAAQNDQNSSVRDRLNLWKTNSYSTLQSR